MQTCSSAAPFVALTSSKLFAWFANLFVAVVCFILHFFLEQRSPRPPLQSSRTEVRRISRQQKSWRKAWRPWPPMTTPLRLLPHWPNHQVAPRKVPPPSLRPRRRKNSSRLHSWKRARSRRRRWRPEVLGHSWPWWNTTVKCFCLQTWSPSRTLQNVTVTLVLFQLMRH